MGKAWGLKSVRGISVGGGARVEVELVWKKGDGVGLEEVERVSRGVKETLKGEEGVREVSFDAFPSLSPLFLGSIFTSFLLFFEN